VINQFFVGEIFRDLLCFFVEFCCNSCFIFFKCSCKFDTLTISEYVAAHALRSAIIFIKPGSKIGPGDKMTALHFFPMEDFRASEAFDPTVLVGIHLPDVL